MTHKSNEEINSFAPSDSFFAVVGKVAEEAMLMECELWERDAGELQVPEITEVQILALARKYEKKQLNKKRDQFITRYAKIAAVIVLLVVASFSVLLANADALRGESFDFIFQNSDAYIKIIPVEMAMADAEAEKNLPADWEVVYYPDYLPEGYRFEEAEAAGSAKTIAFQNEAFDILLLTQEPSDGAEILIDKDGVENGETSI